MELTSFHHRCVTGSWFGVLHQAMGALGRALKKSTSII